MTCTCQPKPTGEAPDVPSIDCPQHGISGQAADRSYARGHNARVDATSGVSAPDGVASDGHPMSRGEGFSQAGRDRQPSPPNHQITRLAEAKAVDLPARFLPAGGGSHEGFLVRRPDEVQNAYARCLLASRARPPAVTVEDVGS